VKNDLVFFDALLGKLTAAYKINPDRVYVIGMSNSGQPPEITRPKVKGETHQ
jgi:poly(3-hydroxybutyrate) depolymerase